MLYANLLIETSETTKPTEKQPTEEAQRDVSNKLNNNIFLKDRAIKLNLRQLSL